MGKTEPIATEAFVQVRPVPSRPASVDPKILEQLRTPAQTAPAGSESVYSALDFKSVMASYKFGSTEVHLYAYKGSLILRFFEQGENAFDSALGELHLGSGYNFEGGGLRVEKVGEATVLKFTEARSGFGGLLSRLGIGSKERLKGVVGISKLGDDTLLVAVKSLRAQGHKASESSHRYSLTQGVEVKP